jgi:hypothetical protein
MFGVCIDNLYIKEKAKKAVKKSTHIFIILLTYPYLTKPKPSPSSGVFPLPVVSRIP